MSFQGLYFGFNHTRMTTLMKVMINRLDRQGNEYLWTKSINTFFDPRLWRNR